MDIWRIFPAPWHLPQHLCLAFCATTAAQLALILQAKVCRCRRLGESVPLPAPVPGRGEGMGWGWGPGC